MQQQSRTLDIITGFQVLDGSQHLFVLEGLRDKAIKEVWETLPQPENSGLKFSVMISMRNKIVQITLKKKIN